MFENECGTKNIRMPPNPSTYTPNCFPAAQKYKWKKSGERARNTDRLAQANKRSNQSSENLCLILYSFLSEAADYRREESSLSPSQTLQANRPRKYNIAANSSLEGLPDN